MGYNILSPAHEEQIKNMRKDGKNPQEVVDFFWANYKIKIPLWKVSYVTSKKSTGVASDEGLRRRAAQRKYSTKTAKRIEPEAGRGFIVEAKETKGSDIKVSDLINVLTLNAGYLTRLKQAYMILTEEKA